MFSWSKAHRRSNRRDQAHHRRHRGGQDRHWDNSKGGCVTHGRSTQPGVLVCAVRSQTAVGGPVSPWELRVADCLKDSIWTTGQRCPSHDPFRTGRGSGPQPKETPPRHCPFWRGFILRRGIGAFRISVYKIVVSGNGRLPVFPRRSSSSKRCPNLIQEAGVVRAWQTTSLSSMRLSFLPQVDHHHG